MPLIFKVLMSAFKMACKFCHLPVNYMILLKGKFNLDFLFIDSFSEKGKEAMDKVKGEVVKRAFSLLYLPIVLVPIAKF